MKRFLSALLYVLVLLSLSNSWTWAGNSSERVLTLSLGPNDAAVKEMVMRNGSAAATRKGVVKQPKARFQSLASPPVGQDQILVKAVDSQGQTLFQRVINDPRVIRGEIFDPVTGAHLFTERFVRQGATAQLLLPDDPGIARIELYPPGATAPFAVVDLSGLAPVSPAPLKRSALQVSGVTTLVNTGDSANRVDIVLMGDGYTAGEMSQFEKDAAEVADAFFNIEPYLSYAGFFNVHRIDLVSSQSGVDHPENNVYKDTALDSGYNCQGIQRLICADETAAMQVAADHLSPDAFDIIVVIVNDSEYGGSGGSISVISTHASSPDLMLHETGHSFGLLGDEYATDNYLCDLTEPVEANVTTILDRNSTKWAYWIDAATPLPTPESYGSAPGLYDGARYCLSGMYRPTSDSMMRTLGVPFESINEEALIKRIYNFADPLDTWSPASTTVNGDTARTFSVTPVPMQNSTLEVTWLLNNQSVGKGNSYTLDPNALSVGNHTLTAQVADATSKVKKDPDKVLQQTLTWSVQRTGGQSSDSTIGLQANGQSQAVTLGKTGGATVAVSLSANKNKGVQGDIWLLALFQGQWFHYNFNAGAWGGGLQAGFQGPLADINANVLSNTLLPPGVLTVFFGYDLVKNGQVDAGVAYEQLVITVQ